MRTRQQSALIIFILGSLEALTPFSIDLYLPAFPEIARDFGTTVQEVALTVPIYFIGFALGQLIYGPLLDRYGRKPPVYLGIVLYILATVGCFQSHSVNQLLFFRFLSALGGSAASVGAVAMVRDYFPAKEAANIFAKLMLVLSVSPLFAPSVGSFLVVHTGWRILFAILALIAVANILLVAFALPNGYTADPTVQLRIKSIFREFKTILVIREFIIPTLAGALAFAGLFVYVASAPAVFMEGFGVSVPAFGIIFGLTVIGMIGGGQLNQFFMRRYSSVKILNFAITTQAVVSVLFFLFVAVFPPNLILTIIFLFLILLAAGITYPNAAALALEPFTKNIGSASSLLGFIQLAVGSVISATIGLFESKGTLPTAASIGVSSVLAWIILRIRR